MQEFMRTLVPQPMSLIDYPDHKPPRPVDSHGERIQVTAHSDEHGRILERWQFSETDVRFYHIEKTTRAKINARDRRGNGVSDLRGEL